MTNFLGFPQYTRPAQFRGMGVPEFYCLGIMQLLRNGDVTSRSKRPSN